MCDLFAIVILYYFYKYTTVTKRPRTHTDVRTYEPRTQMLLEYIDILIACSHGGQPKRINTNYFLEPKIMFPGNFAAKQNHFRNFTVFENDI